MGDEVFSVRDGDAGEVDDADERKLEGAVGGDASGGRVLGLTEDMNLDNVTGAEELIVDSGEKHGAVGRELGAAVDFAAGCGGGGTVELGSCGGARKQQQSESQSKAGVRAEGRSTGCVGKESHYSWSSLSPERALRLRVDLDSQPVLSTPAEA